MSEIRENINLVDIQGKISALNFKINRQKRHVVLRCGEECKLLSKAKIMASMHILPGVDS